ncbi:MAG: hypothetical protein ACO1SV_00755 [Fimbriimonas sp.]
MDRTIRFSPGGLVPFSGRGSSDESDAVSLHWAVASNGLVQRTERGRLDDFVWERGRPPYGRCAVSGYRAPQASMVRVDGAWYIPAFAPAPKGGG